jgi:hypothetical protein
MKISKMIIIDDPNMNDIAHPSIEQCIKWIEAILGKRMGL